MRARPTVPSQRSATPRPARWLAPFVLALSAGCAHGGRDVPAGGAGADVASAARVGARSSLEAQLRDRLSGFRGQAGVYVRHLETGEEVAIAADELFPTASMIKVPFLVALYQDAEAGRLDLDARLVYDDSLFYPSDGDIANKLKSGEAVSLWQLAVLMVVFSDNTASLWIQGLVQGARVNGWLDAHGFRRTRVNSRVEGRRGDWEVYGWGQSTPREMARLLAMIRNGEAVSPRASDTMFRLLSRSWWPDGATSVIPAGVNVAAKPGAVAAARSEVLVVNAPGGDYVLCVMTRDQEDTSWERDNEGAALIRDISAIVYRHFAGGPGG